MTEAETATRWTDRYEQFETFTATLRPADAVRGEAERFIGRTFAWQKSWVIERGPYVGQWACLAVDENGMGAANGMSWWVPECDLQEASCG